MSGEGAQRSAHFPAIERKYGQPMAHWFEVMGAVAGQTYQQQMAFLQQQHGFSRTHANALVLYLRGSTSARRYATLDEYLAPFAPTQQGTARAILAAVVSAFPESEVVIAWNHPMLKVDGAFVLGISIHNAHILIGPWDTSVLERLRDDLKGLTVNKKTFRVPNDWAVDVELLRVIAGDRIAQIRSGAS